MRKDAPIISCFHVSSETNSALNGVSIDVGRRTWTEIIGPAGAGKTSLFSVMSLRARPPQGKLVIGGRNFQKIKAAEVAEVRRIIGSCGQVPLFLEDRTAIENLVLPFVVRGEPRMALEAAEAALDATGLEYLRDRQVQELSFQERAALGVIRAAIGAPAVALIDGVLDLLDHRLRESLMDFLRARHLDGTAIVIFGGEFTENARKGRRWRMEEGQIFEVDRPTLVTDEHVEGVA